MKSIKKVIVILSLALISCTKSKDSAMEKTPLIIPKSKSIEEVDRRKIDFKKSKYFKYDRILNDKYDVMFNGNILSYRELELYYSYNPAQKEEIIPYSMLMIEKHKKYNICSKIFFQLLEFFTGEGLNNNGTDECFVEYFKVLKKIPVEQKVHLLYYLNLGAKNNDKLSIRYLQMINKI